MPQFKKYIYQQREWPKFHWNQAKIATLLAKVHKLQGQLMGSMKALGFELQEQAMLSTLTQDVVKSSEIEGEMLNQSQVRSSIARRLGIPISTTVPSNYQVEGVVEMMLNATQHFDEPLNKTRLLGWHAALFPTGLSGLYKIKVAEWRDDSNGPMQVVSGAYGHEKVHYEAPEAKNLDKEMKRFLVWFNKETDMDPVIKAAIAHFWFVTIHPFEDGNGRIARAIADLALARSDGSKQRFYSMSAQIKKERNAYYDCLEKTQKGSLDLTGWLEWFLNCMERALIDAKNIYIDVMQKTHFWQKHQIENFNTRQRIILNKLLDGFEGKLTSSKWAKITKCSQDTASRDIQDLVEREILIKDVAGGRSTNYFLEDIK